MNPEFKPDHPDFHGPPGEDPWQRFMAAAIAGFLILSCVAALTWWVTPRSPHPSESTNLEEMANQGQATSSPTEPTVASLSPAATDLLIGIGAGEHLVAVSDWDEDQAGAQALPHIGDFDHVDWEKLAAAAPKILITQFGDRMPAGLQQRCQQLGIRIVDVKLEVIEDVYKQADILGDMLDESAQERSALQDLQHRLAAVAAESQNLPPVRAAIAVSYGASVGLIGPNTFHDQLLAIAGGINVAGLTGKPYVNVDREQLMEMAPDVVLDLEPAPPATPQSLRAAARFWASMPDLPAVRNKAVRTITVPYCNRPGWRLADLAEIFFEELHHK